MSKTKGLPLTILKQLLTDIEDSGKTRDQFNLTALLNNSIGWKYGDKETVAGKKLRLQVQKKFYNIKAKTLDQYVTLLDNHQVAPGEGTRRELRQRDLNQQTTAVEDIDVSSDDEEAILDKKSEPEEKSTLEANHSSSSSDSETSSSSNEEELSNPEELQVQVTPVTNAIRRLSSRPSTNHSPLKTSEPRAFTARRKLIFSESPKKMATFPSKLREDHLESFESLNMNGSEERPFTFIVNPDRPESHWGLFEFIFVEKVSQNGYKSNIYHIRTCVPIQDAYAWTAWIPKEKFPNMWPRLIMFRGPSQPFWFREHKPYCEKLEPCRPTTKKLKTLAASIKGDYARQYHHFLAIFPKGTKLENHLFSSNPINVHSNCLGLKARYQDGPKEKDDASSQSDDDAPPAKTPGKMIKVKASCVYWRIGIVDASHSVQLEQSMARMSLFGDDDSDSDANIQDNLAIVPSPPKKAKSRRPERGGGGWLSK